MKQAELDDIFGGPSAGQAAQAPAPVVSAPDNNNNNGDPEFDRQNNNVD